MHGLSETFCNKGLKRDLVDLLLVLWVQGFGFPVDGVVFGVWSLAWSQTAQMSTLSPSLPPSLSLSLSLSSFSLSLSLPLSLSISLSLSLYIYTHREMYRAGEREST